MFYAACVFYGTAFMYNHAILCIFSPILEVEINIIIIIIIIIITPRHECQLSMTRFVPNSLSKQWLISQCLQQGTDKPDAPGERLPSHDFMWI